MPKTLVVLAGFIEQACLALTLSLPPPSTNTAYLYAIQTGRSIGIVSVLARFRAFNYILRGANDTSLHNIIDDLGK